MISAHHREQIREAKDRLVVVVGTGVSVALSNGAPAASWRGLLESGVKRCLDDSLMDDKAAANVRTLIQSDDLDELLAGADLVRRKLDAPAARAFGPWLKDSIGRLKLEDDSLRDVFTCLKDTGVGIATTNYDSLLTDLTGLPPVCASDPARAVEWIRQSGTGILHLHGHWQIPAGVILGSSDYTLVRSSEARQEMQKVFSAAQMLLFLGCGSGGLTDPNIGSLLRWMHAVFKGALPDHICLCRKVEVKPFRTAFGGSAVNPVAYGEDYAELPDALRDLFGLTSFVAPPAIVVRVPSAPAATRTPGCPYDSTRPAMPPVFTGRDDVLKWMTREMESGRSISVVGAPRIGKTSVLRNWLAQVEASGRIVKLLDGDGPEGGNEATFVSAVTGAPAPVEVEAAASVLMAWLQRTAMPGLPPVLIVDEADRLLRAFSRRFFERLRQPMERGLVTLVLATRHTVDEMFAEHNEGSPFGPRLHMRRLLLLDAPAAQSLTGHAGANAPLLLEQCGGHPYFQHLLGHLLFSEGDPAAVLPYFRESADGLLRTMWRELNDWEQRELADCFRNGEPATRERFKWLAWTDAVGQPCGLCSLEWVNARHP